MSVFRIFILIAFVEAVRSQCNGTFVTLEPARNGVFRNLQSPNYGNEHEKMMTCYWIINLPSPKHYVTMYLEDLRLHYRDSQNKIHCMPSYNLTINGEKFGCESGQFVPTVRNEFPIQFRTLACPQPGNWGKIKQIVDKVPIRYTTNGQRVQPGQTPIMNGFKIRYGIFNCSGIGTTQTSISNAQTTDNQTTLSVSTKQQPFNTFTNKGSSSKSFEFSAAMMDSSNDPPISVSNASNPTHGLQLTSTTPPTAYKSHGEDDFDSKVTFTIDMHWIILASALGGGLLLILVVAICCKMQRNKKSKVESDETGTEDSSSNQDETELPAYSTVEDVSPNQKSSQQEETANQNASQTDSNLEEKLVVENVAYEASQESLTISVTQPESTSAESIQNDEHKPTIIDEAGDEFYSVVRLKSNKEKTTVRYLKENILYDDAP